MPEYVDSLEKLLLFAKTFLGFYILQVQWTFDHYLVTEVLK